MLRVVLLMLLLVPLMAAGESRQAQRFEAPLEKLRPMFQAGDATAVVESLANGGRAVLFSLEGMARLYEDQHPEEMSSLREESKWLEDRVGKLIDFGEHIKFAKEVGAPLQTIQYLEKEREKFRDELAEKIEKKGWVGGKKSVVESWSERVRKVKWTGAVEDREYVLEKLVELTDELRKENWDIRELQTGLHDFRRRVRWFLIYLQSLGTLVDFDGRPLEKFGAILEDPVADGKYSKLPPGKRVPFPILIPREVYLELTKAVDELGNAKDMGEAKFEWLWEALHESGAADSKKSAKAMASKMVKEHPKYVPVYKTGETVYEHLREEDKRKKDKEARGLLTALKHRLKEQMDWSLADCRKALRGIKE